MISKQPSFLPSPRLINTPHHTHSTSSYLPVSTASEELTFVGVIKDRLEKRRSKETVISRKTRHVPDDARAVRTGTHTLGVVCTHANVIHGGLVLFHGGNHYARLLGDLPHTHLSIFATTDKALVVRCAGKGSHTTLVSIIDRVQFSTTLGAKCTNLSITPPAHNTATIFHEGDAVALDTLHVDAEKLNTSAAVPHANIIHRASCEDISVAFREGDIVNPAVVAGRAELDFEVRVGKGVHVALVCSDEKVLRTRVAGERRYGTLKASRLCREEGQTTTAGCEPQLCDCSITSTDNEITVSHLRDAIHTLAKVGLGAGAAEELCSKVDLDEVTRGRAAVHELIILIDIDARVHPFQLTQIAVSGSNLSVRHVELPYAKVVVASSYKHVIAGLEVLDRKSKVV
mmetsp:Transcript_49976/g.128619  ORF Transcript_49976/g.128619 Transcript_49976/m.128619 type:complete len:401 (-) Transcript_49976:589-1791(-)